MADQTIIDHNGLFLGIDVGTTNCKAAIGDKTGRIVERVESPCHLEFPGSGLVEADPEKGWWEPLLLCLERLFAKARVGREEIRGIEVSCTNALVTIDIYGKPLRNAIMQLDRRATLEVEEIYEAMGEDNLLAIAGNRAAVGTQSAPSLLWIRKNEPENFKRIAQILSPAGYIIQRLTGRQVIDRTRAATTLLYDMKEGSWSSKLCDALDLPGAILPAIHSSTDIVGRVTGEASTVTGLESGIPVAAGVMDSVAAAYAMGSTTPGETGIILGTVGRVLWPLNGSCFDDRFLNVPLVQSDRWMSVACSNGSGLSIDWFARNLIKANGSMSRRESLELLDREAGSSPPGSNGLIYLPYLAGERSPVWDPEAKGVFFGLDVSHSRGDMARSVMEGTAFSIRDNIEILESVTDTRPNTIRVSGGGTRSPLWPPVLASVLGRDIRVLPEEDSECSGALILAAMGAGPGEDMETLSSRDTGEGLLVSPDVRQMRLYDDLFKQYRSIYEDLRPHFKRLRGTMNQFDRKEEPTG